MRLPIRLDLIDTIGKTAEDTMLLAMRAGQDFGPELFFKLEDGLTAEDMSARTFALTIRREPASDQVFLTGTSADGAGVAGSTVKITAPLTGKIELSVPAARTALIPPGRWWYALADTTGGKIEEMVEGLLDVIRGIARA